MLFNKPLAGQGYYAERLKYVNLPESEYTENFYNLMAETGNLFILNEPEDPEAEIEDGEDKGEKNCTNASYDTICFCFRIFDTDRSCLDQKDNDCE